MRSVLRGLGSRGAADRGDRGPFIDKRISFGTEFLLIFSCRLLFCSSLTVAASAELVVVPSVFEFEAIPGFSMEEIFMLRLNQRAGSLVISIVAMLLSVVGDVHAQAGVKTFTGSFADGATYLIDVPANWNGTLLLYSHGYVIPGTPNPAHDVGDPLTRSYLLSNGYALAGSSYATTGWAVEQALPDQIAVLDTFNSLVGQPSRTIAWGHSLGGMVTAGLVQRFPERFSAALPMCGVLAGGVGTWNVALDVEFAFNVLLAQGTLQVVNITDPLLNLGLAEAALNTAQSTPQGRARIALAAALGDTPGWFDPLSPRPGAMDFAAQEANQFLWLQQVDFPFVFALRADLELRAQGNPSWNTGVDYRKQLERSVDLAEVVALYEEAGLSLDADLESLNQAARIKADSTPLAYLRRNIIFDGQISIPVLTMHTTGDGLVAVEEERAYGHAIRLAHDRRWLRQVFVYRAGHCKFTPAETIAAFDTLVERLNTGKWREVNPQSLNQAASALGSEFNILPPEFIEFEPAPFLRPFNAFRH